MNNQSSSTGVIIGVIVVAVVAIVGWLAYKEGFFDAKTQDTNSGGIEVNVGGDSSY